MASSPGSPIKSIIKQSSELAGILFTLMVGLTHSFVSIFRPVKIAATKNHFQCSLKLMN